MSARGTRRVNAGAAVSVLVALVLVAIGAVRLLSYSTTGDLADGLRSSFLSFLTYAPDSLFSVRFFKVVATPSVVAGMYLMFRLLNRIHADPLVDLEVNLRRRLDFSSPVLRLVLTTLVTLQWIPLELVKRGSADFYPNSPLESIHVNAAVLLLSQALAYQGMKYLSFEPLLVEEHAG